MEEPHIEFELIIPNFRRRKYFEVKVNKRFLNSRQIFNLPEDTILMNILVKLYPNGDTPENEGYVSIIFKLLPYTLLLRNFSFNCTVSVVDISEDLRFRQSFGMISGYDDCPGTHTNLIGLDRFIKRDVLLNSSDEFLLADTLKLHCHCVCAIPRDESFMQRQLPIRESWFVRLNTTDGTIARALKLNRDRPLCTKLREQSDFFKCVFQTHTREMADGFMPIDRDEYDAFYSLMRYIRFGTLKHTETFESYCDIYIAADKYLLREQKEIFGEILKRRLANETAAVIFAVADLCFDPGLRESALEHVYLNWEVVRTTEGWEFLRGMRPHLYW